jgi:hypothetical protein
VEAILADSGGAPILYVTLGRSPKRLRLAPGDYELRVVVDERVVARRALPVGERPVAVELEGRE